MSEIKYLDIIDNLSENGFRQFSKSVYEQLHYSVLTLDELRKVDVKEKLISFVKTTITGKDKSLDFYVGEIKKYLDNYVACKKESRAENYLSKANNLITAIEKKKRTDNDIQDIVKIYISLMRRSMHSKEDEIDNLNFSLSAKDYDFVKSVLTKKLKSKKKVSLNLPSQSTDNKELFYINTVLYLTDILEKEGEFLQEEE